jgi:signal transduction histidine kinase
VQILVNLLDNAAKYSPEQAPVGVGWEPDGALAVVRVRDHGSGIAEEGRDRLFTPFGRVLGSRIRSGRVGTGLGLYVSRGLAQVAQGDLDLESTSPAGTVFRLTLPRADAQGRAAAPMR